jgi:hypothetical protein
LIAKPDIGLRGSGVKKNNTVQDLKEYAEKSKFQLCSAGFNSVQE